MNQQRKNDILASAKTNRVEKIPIVESPYPPEEQNVIWLKDGVMYYFDNNEWEALFSSDEGGGGDDPEPTPEPLGPEYVQTPIRFDNLDVTTITPGGGTRESIEVLYASTNIGSQNTKFRTGELMEVFMIESHEAELAKSAETRAIDEEAYAYRHWKYLPQEIPQDSEFMYTAEQILPYIFPDAQIDLVSVSIFGIPGPTNIDGVLVAIADINSQRKAILLDLGNKNIIYPGANINNIYATVSYQEIPVTDDIINIIPNEQYPIVLTPFVLGKFEEEGNTYVKCAYYVDGITGDIITNVPANDFGTWDVYYRDSKFTQISNPYTVIDSLYTAFNLWEGITTSDILPDITTKCVSEVFGYSNQSTNYKYQGYAYTMKSPNIEGKTLMILSPGPLNSSWEEIEGQTGLTDEQILKWWFDVNSIDQIPNALLYTIYNDGMS